MPYRCCAHIFDYLVSYVTTFYHHLMMQGRFFKVGELDRFDRTVTTQLTGQEFYFYLRKKEIPDLSGDRKQSTRCMSREFWRHGHPLLEYLVRYFKRRCLTFNYVMLISNRQPVLTALFSGLYSESWPWLNIVFYTTPPFPTLITPSYIYLFVWTFLEDITAI